MITLLWASVLAGDPLQAIANPVHRVAAQQCQTGLARKVKGEISIVTVVEFHAAGGQTTLKGAISVLQRPPVKPGEMTPTHVLNLRYAYECRLRSGSVTRTKVSILRN
jgi:hypothetical protein